MSFQSGKNVQTAYKVQAGLGQPASGTGATGFLFTSGNGLELAIADIPSETTRADGQTVLGRNGSFQGSAVYPAELRVGAFDPLIEAGMRGTWSASTTIAATTVTSITTTATTIVGLSGSFSGVKRGDMIKLGSSHTAGNNNKWLRVVDVAGAIITLPAASLAVDATADTAAVITVAKTLVNPTSALERYFTFEDYLKDIVGSLYGTDMKVTKIVLNAQPNKNVTIEFSLVGLDVTPLDGTTTPTAPAFTGSITYSSASPLVMSDGIIRIGGVDYNSLTGFTLTWDMGGEATPTLAQKAPDVFLSSAKISGSFTALKQDMAFFKAARNETIVDFFVVLQERETAPADFISLYVGKAKLSAPQKTQGNEGAMSDSVNWSGGIDDQGGAHAATTMKWATSAA